MKNLILPALLMFVCSAVLAEDKKEPASPLVLKVTSKKESYVWNGGGKTPEEFQKMLDNLAKQKEPAELPAPPMVDLVVEIENTSKEAVTIYVEGDPNLLTLDLTGPKAKVMMYPTFATADFRFPKAVVVEAGKSYTMTVKQLEDGFRGRGRRSFFMAPGEYTLTVSYLLSNNDGGKGELLKSKPITLKVTEK